MTKIYCNGNIITMDDNCPVVQALLVENGKILKRGTDEEILSRKEKDTVCVDLKGKTMLPGFIDGHSHFAGVANTLLQCDLSQTRSFQDIADTMRAYIQENNIPQGQWVSGNGYDHNFLAEKRHPDKFLLDGISTKHPIVIIHASSHMGVSNSLGLQEQKLEDKTKDPAGGHYGRVEATGELDGYMEENAFISFRNRMPVPDIEKFMELFQKTQEIYASYGITTIQEGMVTEPLLKMLRYAQEKKVFYLDLVGYLDLENGGEKLLSEQKEPGEYRNHFKIGGFKIFLDGSPQGRTAWMKEPYEKGKETEGYCGYPIKEDKRLYELILSSLRNGQQLLAHCNGDAAAEQYITQFEKVKEDFPEYEACRPVMVHAQFVTGEQLRRMKDISMMPSFFTAHTYYWGDIHIQNFGRERAGRISPAKEALRLGIPFTLHQDSPVLLPDVFRTIWCAARRITKSGVELSREESISVRHGLKAVTVSGAYQYFEEEKKGTLEEGKMADFVIVDKNPLEIPLEEVKTIQVLETIKEGVTIYKRRKEEEA